VWIGRAKGEKGSAKQLKAVLRGSANSSAIDSPQEHAADSLHLTSSQAPRPREMPTATVKSVGPGRDRRPGCRWVPLALHILHAGSIAKTNAVENSTRQGRMIYYERRSAPFANHNRIIDFSHRRRPSKELLATQFYM